MVQKIVLIAFLVLSNNVYSDCAVSQLDANGDNIYISDKKLEYEALISELDQHAVDESGNSIYFLSTEAIPQLPMATFGANDYSVGYTIDLNPFKPQFEIIGAMLVFISAYIAFFKIIA